jgi:hypothetical protein
VLNVLWVAFVGDDASMDFAIAAHAGMPRPAIGFTASGDTLRRLFAPFKLALAHDFDDLDLIRHGFATSKKRRPAGFRTPLERG